MALFKIYQEKSGDFRILLKLNSQIEFISSRQKSKYDCYYLIKIIRKISELASSYIKKTSDCGSIYFKLVDKSYNKELGESMLYINDNMLNSKIEIMKLETACAKLDSKMYSV
ncbi:hypothetical protein [Winogradskyella immobilis]|uniref:Four helix bundle protein n=1 Tax=Winogradskyella immobilis TaxID=2816852 RepID=A0ABS8EL70_9FLAO|nr:hypothetical protein [Winogradskyella immobilis]MCC1483057.1 hypothetical protein [Winogradskyella immobilis]MCG0015152.1 hypothetical protein [Winogradskyella immobilis]